MTDPAAYATFAYVLAKDGEPFVYSVAAHLLLFHFQRRSGAVQRCSVENLPLAMFPHTRYQTATIDIEPGDIRAIVTDGLTEVFNKGGEELGEQYIQDTLARLSGLPLAEVADGIFREARAFGRTTDDQTLLLLRRIEAH